jgi:hypothetical protein
MYYFSLFWRRSYECFKSINSTVKQVGNGETDEGRASLTCDIQLNSEMSSGWILEIHSAAIDAFVSQRCPVDNQVTFAGYLTVKRETKVGSQSKRNYLGPSSTHWQWLAASIEPVLNDNKAQGDGYCILFCLPFSISVMNSTQKKKKTRVETDTETRMLWQLVTDLGTEAGRPYFMYVLL